MLMGWDQLREENAALRAELNALRECPSEDAYRRGQAAATAVWQGKVEALEKRAQRYYNEASDGWTKYRNAEKQIEALKQERATNAKEIHDLTRIAAGAQHHCDLLTLHWSTANPVTPGWYWYKDGATGIEMAWVEDGRAYRQKVRIEMVKVEDLGGHWAGPIQIPEE